MKKSFKITSAVLVLMLLLAQVVCVQAATGTVSLETNLSSGFLYVNATTSSDIVATKYQLYLGSSVVKEQTKSGYFEYPVTSDYSDRTAIKVVVTDGNNKTYSSDTDYLDLSAPSISVSAVQSDLYVKTVTASFRASSGSTYGYTNGVTTVTMQPYKTKSQAAGGVTSHNFSDATQCSMSIDVRPTDVSYVKVTAQDEAGLTREYWYSISGNGSVDYGGSSSSNGSWTGIQSGSGSSGSSEWWENTNSWTGVVDNNNSSSTVNDDSYTTYYVICRALNVRSGAGTSFKKAGKVYRGGAVKVVDVTAGGWAKIKFDGSYGYVSMNYLSK